MGKRRRKGWMCTMNFCLRQLGTLEFWETLLDSFGNLGPIAPIVLALLPFAPSSFMHLAFGISDFDEKRYLITMLLGKGVMIAMMAVFGQSLVSSMKNPLYLVLAVLLWGGMYWVSKQFCKKHNLE